MLRSIVSAGLSSFVGSYSFRSSNYDWLSFFLKAASELMYDMTNFFWFATKVVIEDMIIFLILL